MYLLRCGNFDGIQLMFFKPIENESQNLITGDNSFVPSLKIHHSVRNRTIVMFAWIIVLLLIYYLGFVNADHIGLMAYPFRVFQNMLPMVMCVFMTIFFYTSAIRITRSHRVEQWKEKLKARLSRIGNGEGKTLTKSQWLNRRKVVLIGGILMCESFVLD